MVEVKNGDTFQGMLESIDKFMNIKISEAIQTSKDGLDFFHCKELFIKGTSLKYFRLVEAALDKAIEESNICQDNQLRDDHTTKQKDLKKKKKQFQQKQVQRGGRPDRGGGGGFKRGGSAGGSTSRGGQK